MVNLIQRGIASLDRINVVMEWKPRVEDPAVAASADEAGTGISIRGLNFQYEGTTGPQLMDISLEVPAGKTIGIVGPVGSGKSTLVHLLARLYPVDRGMISIGGRDINDWPLGEIRKRIAFVFQETFLFSDTIEWNIRFGAPDNAPFSDVERAAKMAHVDHDIMEFPKKYSTVLGERGVNLSGGQKQRVAIARALIGAPPLVLADEPTAALDAHSGLVVTELLREVAKERGGTVVVVTHDNRIFHLADRIVHIEDGLMKTDGAHA